VPGLILLRQKNSRLPPVNTTIPVAMAKNKGKRSSGANAVSPDGGVPVNTSNSGADNPPKLEENAFAGLRQKIEQKLKGENAAKQKPKNKAKDAAGDSEKKGKTASPKPASKQESNKNKGQKRDRNGDVIAREEKSAGEEKSKPSNGNENDALRQEILALGGTQEDFDMLAGVGSESEVEDAAGASKESKKKSNDDSLRKELSSMLASAGQVAPGDLDEAEEGSEDNTKDEDGDDESLDGEQSEDGNSVGEEISDVEEETPQLPAEPAQEPSKPSKKEKAKESAETEPEDIIPKEYSKLVSISQCFSDIELMGCRLFLHDRTGTPLLCLRFRLQRKGNHSRAIW
jgi:ribosome biogenesis protein MAK21